MAKKQGVEDKTIENCSTNYNNFNCNKMRSTKNCMHKSIPSSKTGTKLVALQKGKYIDNHN